MPIDGSGELVEFIKGADQPHVSGDTLMYHSGTSVHARNLKNNNEKVVDPALLDPDARAWIYDEETFASVFEADGTYSMHIEHPDEPDMTITGLAALPSSRLYASSQWVSFVIEEHGPEKLPTNYLYDISERRLWIVKPGITGRSAQGRDKTFFYETAKSEELGSPITLKVFEFR